MYVYRAGYWLNSTAALVHPGLLAAMYIIGLAAVIFQALHHGY